MNKMNSRDNVYIKNEHMPEGMGSVPFEEIIKNLGNYCYEICSCKKLSQLIMDDKTLIKFRKNVCNTPEYKNCGKHLSELFGWENERDKHTPNGMGSISQEEILKNL